MRRPPFVARSRRAQAAAAAVAHSTQMQPVDSLVLIGATGRPSSAQQTLHCSTTGHALYVLMLTPLTLGLAMLPGHANVAGSTFFMHNGLAMGNNFDSN